MDKIKQQWQALDPRIRAALLALGVFAVMLNLPQILEVLGIH